MWHFINTHPGLLTGALTVITLAASAIRYFHLQTRESNNTQFQEYHALLKQLVSGDGGQIFIERQAAILFELRNYPRYYEFTIRILVDLENLWNTRTSLPLTDPLYLDPNHFLQMQRELLLTIKFIKEKKCWLFFKCYKDETF